MHIAIPLLPARSLCTNSMGTSFECTKLTYQRVSRVGCPEIQRMNRCLLVLGEVHCHHSITQRI